ncbi:MAG TPA: hypothetical protein VGN12_19550 [Pirellulales bacterium]
MIPASLPLTILPPAADELRQAMRWYDGQARGLGRVFLAEANQQVRRIMQFPEAYPVLVSACRRAALHRFPYAIWYRVLPATVEVVAVFDTRGDPERIGFRVEALP